MWSNELLFLRQTVEEEIQEEEDNEKKIYNSTFNNAFENGEAISGIETASILDWRQWDIMKVGVGVAVALGLLLMYTVYQCKFSKRARDRTDPAHCK